MKRAKDPLPDYDYYLICYKDRIPSVRLHGKISYGYWRNVPEMVIAPFFLKENGNLDFSNKYEGDSKTSRFYYPVKLPPWRSLQMIRQLDRWYADTDLDCREYARQYQRIVSGILHGLVILNPKKFALKEVIAEWGRNFPQPEKSAYRTAFDEIYKGRIPIVRVL